VGITVALLAICIFLFTLFYARSLLRQVLPPGNGRIEAQEYEFSIEVRGRVSTVNAKEGIWSRWVSVAVMDTEEFSLTS